MVKNITNCTRSGLGDWLVQRVSAIILSIYLLVVVGFFIFYPRMDYWVWSGLFQTTWMRIFSLLALVALIMHSWVGVWTVLTDYFSPHLLGTKATVIRLSLQVISFIAMFGYLIWGVEILWGI